MSKYSQSASDAKSMTLVTAEILKELDIETYFGKFTSTKPDNIVWKKTDLEKTSGDSVTFSLDALDDGQPKTTGQSLQNNAISPTYFTHNVQLSLIKDAILYDNEMTPQRSPFDIDDESAAKIKAKMVRDIDRLHFEALSTSPTRVIYMQSGTEKQTTTEATAIAALTTSDKITPRMVSWAKTWAKTGGGSNNTRTQPPLEPIMVDGKEYYILLVHPDVMFDFKYNATYQQYIREAEVRGKENPIFTGAVAIIDGVIIHEHERMPILTTGGGGTVPYAKCRLLGKNALCQAWGSFKGQGKKGQMFIEAHLGPFQEVAGYYYKAMVQVEKPIRNSQDFGSLGFYVARTNVAGA